MYLVGKDNTCADLQSRIPKQLEAKSVRAYKIQVINLHKLKNYTVLEVRAEETPGAISIPHCRNIIKESLEDSEIAAIRVKVEADDTSRYMLREGGVILSFR